MVCCSERWARIQSIKGPTRAPSRPRSIGRSTNCACRPSRCGGTQSARHAGGGLHAIVLPNDVKTKIDAGGAAGRG
jgi:hypothetical protein